MTIISGTLNLGMGDAYDAAAVTPLTAGSYSGVTELQLATNGPWAIHYVNPADDPRKAGKGSRAGAR